MKKYLVMLAGSLLLAATAATASPQQGHDQQSQQAQNRHDQRKGQVKYVHDNRGVHDNHGRYYVAHDSAQHGGWYKRGGHLPAQYRANRYYVTNWSAYRLRQPPRGYRWVRSDNSDFLLVAIATGVITDIVLSH